jgi:hyaluronate lyase
LIATVSSNNFVDLTASSSSVPYYYVITGLNAFGDESADSSLAAATVGAVWRQQWFGTTANTGRAADTANPAGDGVINLLKRAFNLNPLVVQTNGLPHGTLNGGSFTMTYRKSLAATDLVFQVQCSGNLVNWTTNGITDTVVSSDGFTEIHTATKPVTSSEQFMRLNVIPTQ